MNYSVDSIRLYPNQQQAKSLIQGMGSCRFVYNYFLDFKIKKWKEYGKSYSFFDICKLLVKLKQINPWLYQTNSQALQHSLKNLHQSFTNFYKHGRGFPKFKKKGVKDVIAFPQACRVNNDKLFIQKYGDIKFKGNIRNKNKTIKTVTVTYKNNKFYASILYEDFNSYKKELIDNIVGVDFGVVNPLTVTDGDTLKYVGKSIKRRLKKVNLQRLRQQRNLSRKKKGSFNYNKNKIKVGLLFEKEQRIRKDFAHQVSYRLASKFNKVAIEDLNISNMTKSSKGTITNPGVNVKQKSGLNRELLNIGIGRIVQYLSYKTNKYGGKLILVNPSFTSQECNKCGYTHKNNRKNQATFECLRCNNNINADYNAALNIRNRAFAA